MQALSLTWRRLATTMKSSVPVLKCKKIVKVAFSDKYLLYTNVSISVTLSGVGDCLAQSYEIYTVKDAKFDKQRTFHMACSGAAVGVWCHYWYKILDRILVGKTIDIVLKKLFLDQMIFSPIMIATFFGSVALFDDDPWQNFKEEVNDKFVTLYKAEWMVWPPAQIINFYFLPTRFRVLYDNMISLGYDVYTSKVKYNKSLTTLNQNGKR